MFKAVITERGRAWREEVCDSRTRDALTSLISPPLEAVNPRALFDVFCERQRERIDAHLSTDDCRILWRTLCGTGAITLRRGAESYRDPLGRLDEVAINH